jgi:predicted Fe-Mo cluster-binding NifX family protein
MKLAISASGQTLDSDLDPRFGRAKYFLLVDSEGGGPEVVENKQNLQLAQGAGIQAAQTVVEKGAQAVLTGNCGPKAFRVLQAARVSVAVGLEGSIREVIQQFVEGKIQFAQEPNVEGHWG